MMQDATITSQETEAHARKAPLPLRDDTLLGVCEGLGEELGFNPLWLRVALAAGLLWNPAAIVGGYLAVGLVIALARFLFPPAAAAAVETPAQPSAAPPAGQVEKEQERELIAA